MIEMTVAQVADIVGGELADISAAEAATTRITGTVEFDSRAVTSGGLFLALPGARSDGHDFAARAVEAGAAAVLAARPVGVPAIVVPPAVAGDAGSGAVEHDDAAGSGAAVLAALAMFRLGNILRRLTRDAVTQDLSYRHWIAAWAGRLTRIIAPIAIMSLAANSASGATTSTSAWPYSRASAASVSPWPPSQAAWWPARV